MIRNLKKSSLARPLPGVGVISRPRPGPRTPSVRASVPGSAATASPFRESPKHGAEAETRPGDPIPIPGPVRGSGVHGIMELEEEKRIAALPEGGETPSSPRRVTCVRRASHVQGTSCPVPKVTTPASPRSRRVATLPSGTFSSTRASSLRGLHQKRQTARGSGSGCS